MPKKKTVSIAKPMSKLNTRPWYAVQTFKYNLFHRTFTTNLRALQGNMYFGEVTLLYTCGVFLICYVYLKSQVDEKWWKQWRKLVNLLKSAKISWNDCNNNVAVSTYHKNRKLSLLQFFYEFHSFFSWCSFWLFSSLFLFVDCPLSSLIMDLLVVSER